MMKIFVIGLASPALAVNIAAAKSCVAKAQLSCDAEFWPDGSTEARCINIHNLDWTSPLVRQKAECYCGEDGKLLLQQWWDCFYQRAFACPNRSEKFATSYMIWIAESCWHRGTRRLFCNDDWKPTPPWDSVGDHDLKQFYEQDDPYQYSFDSERTAKGLPWHGCDSHWPEGYGVGWP